MTVSVMYCSSSTQKNSRAVSWLVLLELHGFLEAGDLAISYLINLLSVVFLGLI